MIQKKQDLYAFRYLDYYYNNYVLVFILKKLLEFKRYGTKYKVLHSRLKRGDPPTRMVQFFYVLHWPKTLISRCRCTRNYVANVLFALYLIIILYIMIILAKEEILI